MLSVPPHLRDGSAACQPEVGAPSATSAREPERVAQGFVQLVQRMDVGGFRVSSHAEKYGARLPVRDVSIVYQGGDFKPRQVGTAGEWLLLWGAALRGRRAEGTAYRDSVGE